MPGTALNCKYPSTYVHSLETRKSRQSSDKFHWFWENKSEKSWVCCCCCCWEKKLRGRNSLDKNCSEWHPLWFFLKTRGRWRWIILAVFFPLWKPMNLQDHGRRQVIVLSSEVSLGRDISSFDWSDAVVRVWLNHYYYQPLFKLVKHQKLSHVSVTSTTIVIQKAVLKFGYE